MTKAEQLGSTRIRPKKEATFGKSSNGSFGKKEYKGSFKSENLNSTSDSDFGTRPSNGNFGKEPSIMTAKPKAKAGELPYLEWLHEDGQASNCTCIVCDKPAQDWHHVKLHSMDKKDHKRLIPLCKALIKCYLKIH